MSRYEIFLGDCHIHQFIIRIHHNKIQAFLQLGAESPTEAIRLRSVGICMIASILTQVIEGLCILQHCVRTLSQIQEFIQFALEKTRRNMMSSESHLELLPSHRMVSGKHAVVMIPPHACCTV
jgi:hypothetical protein